ncbi:MAG: PLP-dependent aminotransferase family protein [Bacteroidota bacterium]
MLPFKTLISIDQDAKTPIYLQISNAIIKLVSNGHITSGQRLPGSRKMASLLSVNRGTIITAYEELQAQGWVFISPNQGCFISEHIPIREAITLDSGHVHSPKKISHFPLENKFPFLQEGKSLPTNKPSIFSFDDGYPDVRLSPLKEISNNLSFVMKHPRTSSLMNYTQSFDGDLKLREVLKEYLAENRSIHVGVENIFLTRGSLMGFYLLSQIFIQPDDLVVVSNPGFREGYMSVKVAGGKLAYVSVDEEGMCIEEVEAICKQEQLRAVFIVPHHQYPTTVTLSPSRRMQLLSLAEKYQFAIIEDDYDYDFHYSSSPILPIFSADRAGLVAYVGSFSKVLAPGLRLGYVVAPENVIHQISLLSRYIDSFGNTGLERAIAYLITEGYLQRHLKKAVNIYRERRDLFCEELHKQIGHQLSFVKPEGGLAVWLKLPPNINYKQLRQAAQNCQLSLPASEQFWDPASSIPYVGLRIGFASLAPERIPAAVEALGKVLSHFPPP